MSDIDKVKIAEAMNYIDPDYITEYEGLSSYAASRKLIRRRRIRIMSRVAACFAIVGTGVLIAFYDLNHGLMGGSKSASDEYDQNYGNTDKENYGYDIDSSEVLMPSETDMTSGDVSPSEVFCEDITCEAPASEITATVVALSGTSLTLQFTVTSDKKWHIGDGISIYSYNNDGTAELIYNSNSGHDADMTVSENGLFTYTCSWSDGGGPLDVGKYDVVVYITDGETSYAVSTKIVISGDFQ